jgi:hypothetical protein
VTYSGICMEEMSKTTKQSQDRRRSFRNSNRTSASSVHESLDTRAVRYKISREMERVSDAGA